ncbi:MAG TPA: threonylcarbamoyl-AMP synthase [Algoriphagus sp.]|jgi:tRNA threonylcarbamoyl adenosine modification protein (Sua5/YciO/YrdC/YwlC family)|uniref:L-threonylcarbamoyladenylate synthase n=1 Tax=unclassified Algoriphagus TaxID=2641541 RepID=UPI000C577026|nr:MULTISPECIES: L-threonylcarbamoyladenylate synthase [unclassified Algoriphagus]MAL13896.1 threonylcarbamoyl-AMP synthase [Algoriphagus sp.]MAL14935.1 threonylcarbamoyl-AMP synthase [Algoriphagus sp.]QYH37669.1 threonylcarbamoyl-AMP synthase [Algoriphagus sp. NBT04N3]HAD52771.1 threonylcarbamoyl-AMP synthase [Algoriphagus sp.]HAH38909.1 threonylcarbamoyl-AMP synthase [Algoriphagus sp.]
MPAEFIRLYEENPEPKKVKEIVEILRDGGVVIYPTDTVYGMGCDITNQRAIERIAKIKGINPKKHNFSFICADLSDIAQYTRVITKPVFKMMKKAFPGPFTFILEANSTVPKILHSNKKTVGIRVPNHNIPRTLVQELGQPILTTSIHDEDEVVEYSTDPELIFEKYQHLVDVVIDGGYGQNVASTILNCTGDEVEVIREGLGNVEDLF